MFPEGGAVTSEMMHPTARIQTVISTLYDISGVIGDRVLLYDPDYEMVIHGVYLLYRAAGGVAAATLNIGTPTDDNAIVAGYVTSTTNGIGDNASATLASTLVRPGIHKYGGKPVVPKNTQVVTSVSQAISGTGDFALAIQFSKVVPST